MGRDVITKKNLLKNSTLEIVPIILFLDDQVGQNSCINAQDLDSSIP